MNIFGVFHAFLTILPLVYGRQYGEGARALGGECQGVVCTDPNSHCVANPESQGSGICMCKPGYVEEADICKVRAGGECKDSKSCVNNATCRGTAENLQCLCDAKFVEEAGLCKVLPGGACTESIACVNNSVCEGAAEDLRCRCVDGFVADAGGCRVPDGGECVEASDCVDDALCTGTDGNGRCACNASFVADAGLCKIPNGGDCTHTSECVSNSSCTGIGSTQQCECDFGFVPEGGSCKATVGVECTDTSSCVLNASCLVVGGNRRCACDLGFVEEEGLCKVPVGGDCTLRNECVANAICLSPARNRKCHCNQGFVVEAGRCRRPKLGEECDPDGDPVCEQIPNGGECLLNGGGSHTCQCQSGYVSDDGACRLPSLGEECSPQTGCEKVPNGGLCLTSVGSTGTCKCQVGFVEDGKTCKKPLEGDCTDSIDCVSNAACNTDSKCECNPGYEPEKTTGLCRKVNASLHEDCDPGVGACISPNAACVGDPGLEACSCKPGFVDNEDSCNASVDRTTFWRYGGGDLEGCERSMGYPYLDERMTPNQADDTEAVPHHNHGDLAGKATSASVFQCASLFDIGSIELDSPNGDLRQTSNCDRLSMAVVPEVENRLPSLGEDCIPAPGPGCEEITNGECLGNEGGLATCKCLNAFVEDGGAC
ncbi:unnamed protein product [Darwinula stevensoni]|uniref:EGF-like domain-containing protein n=1 Tax=Darwinula stevensoni TaxID=69355 RepID=A0A7R8XAH2_9CRUS|nr:unnamed protein product [Darwinula stevensoni]CAG0891886.1 unnamed protein product [Darwinula stevensoni]